jgi:hypothetical protein
LARDFKAEAIAAKKLNQQQERQANPYKAPYRSYPPRTKPEHMTTEEWRHDCQVYSILHGLPNQEQRRKYFEDVERIHGAAPRQRLEQDVMALWIKEKDQTA